MKKVLVALCLLGSVAHAETDLACWSIYSKKGDKPLITAKIGDNNELQAQVNLQAETFTTYFFDNKSCGVGGCSYHTGKLEQLNDTLVPSLITTKRSPYVGNNEYAFVLGSYDYKFVDADKTSENQEKHYDVNARLVLPTDLSTNALKAFRIRTNSERSNAVLIMDPSADSHQGGSNYFRLYCVSK